MEAGLFLSSSKVIKDSSWDWVMMITGGATSYHQRRGLSITRYLTDVNRLQTLYQHYLGLEVMDSSSLDSKCLSSRHH